MAQPQIDGTWSALENWPLIAIHAAITPDGRVLTYGTDGAGRQTGYFIYDIWDPSQGISDGHLTLANMTLTDIFCSSQVILPQSGEILIAGGDNWTGSGTTNTGNNNSNLFDFSSNTLARSQNMNRARWYSSSTVLIDGDVYIQGGSSGGDLPEVRTADSSFRLLTGVSTSSLAALYPRNFIAPDGRVFGYDSNANMYFVNPSGTGTISRVGAFSSSYVGWTSGAAMFAPGKILQAGGNSNGAVVIDINGPTPTVTPTGSMSSKRQWLSATVLPDGRVLGTNGSEQDNQLIGVNTSAEIWDPATGVWHVGTSGAVARMYHSSSLLLPDATVLVAGGGAPGPLVNTNAEIYYPPYLYDDSGALAPRPSILNAPDTADVGATLTIDVDVTDISRVTLVKTGSVTHSVNMDQRFIELPFSASANVLYAQLPQRASDTPPGFYHLFVLDSHGVPSHASMLHINVDPTPSIGVDYTPTIGGGGGSPFQLACDADQTLVGVHGKFATYINQVGPQCVQVDQFGHWIGNPVDKPVTGTTTTGTSFSKTCPRDSAVSGFQGNSASYVDQIDIQCKALTPTGGLTGTGEFLGAVGGTGGTPQGTLTCGTGNPGYALYGRSGGWLDSFGVQCRTSVITPISTNSLPVVVNPGNQSGIVGVAVDLTIAASDSDGDTLAFSATGLPTGLSIDPANGRITGIPSTAGVWSVGITVSDGTSTGLASFSWTIEQAAPLVVDPVVPQPSREVNTPVTFTANATGGLNVVYNWNFGDGTPETGYSAANSVEHSFSSPGIYFVTLTVDDDLGSPQIQQFMQTIHLPAVSGTPGNSSTIAFEENAALGDRIWVVNRDNDSVSVFDRAGGTRLGEIGVGAAPRAIAIAPDGRIWVTNKETASISVIDSGSLSVVQTIALPFGSEPYGLVFGRSANKAFVVLEGAGELLALDAGTGALLGTTATGGHPRHLAIDASETNIYVSRFVTPPQPGEDTAVVGTNVGGVNTGGEVLVIDAVSLALLDRIVLQHSDKFDAENQGAGVPNYLAAAVISPDGQTAVVPSKQDNIARGTLRSGQNLNFQNTVRAISSRIDLAAGAEDYSRRIDHDNASVASAAVFDGDGVYLFVALETSREVAVVDAYRGQELFRFDVGRAPQGLAISPDGAELYVDNFMDRSVGVYDLTELRSTGQYSVPELTTWSAVTSEALPPTVLLGKQLFYDARDLRLARDSYMSCASCHNDGGFDGRVWDLTGMGEGLRSTINLKGTGAAHGPLHWSENFDEVQDFEGQIRTLSGGTGLMTDADFLTGTRSEPLGDPKAGLSADLDALAAYVASLTESPVSPYRNGDGTLTADALLGRDVFVAQDCAQCHSGANFTDSAMGNLHDIGTLKPTSGSRLGGALTGIDTPTLRGVWQTAPYLHDGSAPSLADAVAAHNGVALTAEDMTNLTAYLREIDALELTAPTPPPPPNQAPVVTNPGAQSGEVGDSVDLQIVATDGDGDTLGYGATGLPAGLSINATTGRITGTLTSASAGLTTVTVSDGKASPSVSFQYTVTANQAPAVTNPGAQSGEVGDNVDLQIVATDGDGDTLGYSATGLPAGLSINATTGRITGTLTSAGSSLTTVTVGDGKTSSSVDFQYTVTVNQPPSITNPGAQSGEVGDSVDLQIVASDGDGDTLSYSATGLPAGLSINATTGRITGTLASVSSGLTTVTVADGKDSASVSFDYTVTEPPPSDTTPPSAPSGLNYSIESAGVLLTWNPSSDDVGVAGYIVYLATSSKSSASELARTTATSYLDQSVGRKRTYYYEIQAYDEAGNLSELSPRIEVRIR